MLDADYREKSKYVDVAAYYVQQAIEKSLKCFLHNIYGVDDTTRSFRIHNIATLFNELERFNSDFSEKYQDLRTVSVAVSNWEALSRYEEWRCSTRTEVLAALGIAERLYEDIRAIDAERNADRNEETTDVSWRDLWERRREAHAAPLHASDAASVPMQDDDDFSLNP
ncbi:MAG: HEPN domain-containing protein [Desulfovibrio sp.]|nr:HEPN domain-containing protein [Desulfovibrio sp.]